MTAALATNGYQDLYDGLQSVNWNQRFPAHLHALAARMSNELRLGNMTTTDLGKVIRVNAPMRQRSNGATFETWVAIAVRPDQDRMPVAGGMGCSCGASPCVHQVTLVNALREALEDMSQIDHRHSAIVSAFTNMAERMAKAPPADVTRQMPMSSRVLVRLSAAQSGASEVPRLRATLSIDPPTLAPGQPRGSVSQYENLSIEELGRYTTLSLFPLGSLYGQSTTEFFIRARQQEDVLLAMAAQGQVSFEGRNLEPAPECTPQLKWRMDADATQHLELEGDDGCAMTGIVKAHGLLQVDLKYQLIGRVNCSEAMYNLTRATPVLAQQDSRRVAGALAAQTVMPVPEDASVIHDWEGTPTASVTVRMLDRSTTDSAHPVEQVPVADVSFTYDGFLVTPEDFGRAGAVIRKTRSGLRRIHQDTQAEEMARKKLADAGLVRQPGGEGVYVMAGKRAADKAVFLNGLEAARCAGLEVANANVIEFVDVSATTQDITTIDDEDGTSRFFAVGMGVEIDGKRRELAGIIANVLSDPNFSVKPVEGEPPDLPWAMMLDDGQIIRLPLAQIRQLIAPVAEWLETGSVGKDGKIRISRMEAAALADEIGLARAGLLPDLRTAIARLRSVVDDEVPATPPGFIGTLRPYQREGVAWLNALAEGTLGGTLQDDMGLGKTIQVLAHVQHLKNTGRVGPGKPVLIVVTPTSVGGWIKEAARFTPGLRTLNLTGMGRAQAFGLIPTVDIAFTTFSLVWRDIEALREHEFQLCVVDEAHRIRNPLTQQAMTVRRLRTPRFVAMTGTPIQNHLGDLWANVDLVLPGLVGERKHFDRAFRTPIEKRADTERLAKLQRRIAPFMLRRTKEQVAKDLPEKTEVVRTITLGDKQRKLYEAIRAAQAERVKQAIAERGLDRAGIQVLDALMKMRQACCDPQLVKLDSARVVKESAKREALMELVGELLAENHRVLIFSQFVEMIHILENAIEQEGIGYLTLTGQTPTAQRQSLVDKFQEGTTPVFLISLMAGGEALTLTAADSVVIFDPWWNPKAEDQAAARAHRIGQDKPVFVYKLICDDTVEVVIQQMKGRKAALADSVLDGGTTTSVRFDEDDIRELFGENALPRAKRA